MRCSSGNPELAARIGVIAPSRKESQGMKTNFRIGTLATFASLLLGLAGCVLRPVWRGDEGTAYDVLNRSTVALLEIERDALAGPFGSEMRHSCAVFVFPGHVKGVPTSAATHGDGVLLVRDRSTGHWSGPAFYALHGHNAGGSDDTELRGLAIAVGCDALRRLYADEAVASAAVPAATIGLDEATLADMTAWTLSSGRPDRVSLDAMTLRPLPVISLAYYQASAPLAEITVDRSVRNDASGEILAAIESVAN
jgi:lipid-binding SYLF domain-containing protein